MSPQLRRGPIIEDLRYRPGPGFVHSPQLPDWGVCKPGALCPYLSPLFSDAEDYGVELNTEPGVVRGSRSVSHVVRATGCVTYRPVPRSGGFTR